jgi:glycosyltransferase involved in cell wall biosynthesis
VTGWHAAERLETGLPADEARIRVCVVAPSIGILGGQAIQAVRLVEGLNTMPALSVTFVPINPQLPGLLGKLQRVKYMRTLLTETAYIATLLRELRRADVVHIFSASYLSFVLAPTPALLIARMYDKGTVLNYRSGEAEDHVRRWRTAVPTLRLADQLVVPSGYLADVFGAVGLQTRVVANVVDLERFRYRRRDPLRPVFLANRNFEAHYNVSCVIKAFALIRQEIPGAQLIIAGDGSERTRLGLLADRLGRTGIRFVGRIAPDQMPALYDEADIYLNAPDIDNMPGSIIEAFAAGLPVVSTRAGGIPYMVHDQETGLLVDLDDHEAMAAASLRLLREPAFAVQVASRAHDECRTRYHWRAVSRQWLELYQHILSKRRTRGAPTVADSVTDRGV